jgi:hypothetical protein
LLAEEGDRDSMLAAPRWVRKTILALSRHGEVRLRPTPGGMAHYLRGKGLWLIKVELWSPGCVEPGTAVVTFRDGVAASRSKRLDQYVIESEARRGLEAGDWDAPPPFHDFVWEGWFPLRSCGCGCENEIASITVWKEQPGAPWRATEAGWRKARGRGNAATAANPKFVVRSPAEGLKVIKHPDITANFDKALKRTPKNKVAVLVPCAATKPFPDAPSHKSGYLAALAGKKIDKHVVSEPLGIVPYEWSRTYPNDSYDFPPPHLTGAAFDELARRIGRWFKTVGPKYDRIYLALPAHHSRLVKAALGGKTPKNVTWAGQRQCLDSGSCATGEYRATTHAYRGFLKAKVR